MKSLLKGLCGAAVLGLGAVNAIAGEEMLRGYDPKTKTLTVTEDTKYRAVTNQQTSCVESFCFNKVHFDTDVSYHWEEVFNCLMCKGAVFLNCDFSDCESYSFLKYLYANKLSFINCKLDLAQLCYIDTYITDEARELDLTGSDFGKELGKTNSQELRRLGHILKRIIADASQVDLLQRLFSPYGITVDVGRKVVTAANTR